MHFKTTRQSLSLLFEKFFIFKKKLIDNDYVDFFALLLFFYRTKVNFWGLTSRCFTKRKKAGSNLGLTGFNWKVWMLMKFKY